MIKTQIIFLLKILLTCHRFNSAGISAQPAEIKLQIDGATKYQTMDGFGVNINPAWWYNGSYTDAKVVNLQLTCLLIPLEQHFRAVIEEIDWEAVNDDNDPDHFNWDYYNKVFSNARFTGSMEYPDGI